MSLKLKVSSCVVSNCSKLLIRDITGLYNASFNTAGWNSPNLPRVDIGTATLTVVLNGISKDYDVSDTVLNATADTFDLLLIDIADFNLTTFPGGLYTVTYVVTDPSGDYDPDYTVVHTGLSTCAEQCCIDNRFKQFPDKLAACCNKCDEAEFIKETYIAQALIDGLQSAYLCGNFNVINKNLKRIQRICLNQDCGCN